MSENFSLRKVFLAYILIWWNFLMRIYKITCNLPNRRTKNDLLLSLSLKAVRSFLSSSLIFYWDKYLVLEAIQIVSDTFLQLLRPSIPTLSYICHFQK